MKKLLGCIFIVMLLISLLTACSPTTDTLMKAIEKSNLAEVQKIVKQINVNEKNADGEIPVLQAVKKGNVEILQALIDAGAKCDVQDKDGNTPLHLAISAEKDDIIILFLSKENVLDIKNASDKTPLDVAEDTQNYALLTKISYGKGILEDVIKYGELAVDKNGAVQSWKQVFDSKLNKFKRLFRAIKI